MTAAGFWLFETAIGACGIAWNEQGVVCCLLPETSPATTRARLARSSPDAAEIAPPEHVVRAIADIQALLQGEARDLSSIALDMRAVTPFRQRVYNAARQIPVGQTVSYGELARQI